MMLYNTRLTRMLASVLAVTLLTAPAWDAWGQGRGEGERNRKPAIDRESEVTSRDQIGVLQNNFLILCPNDTKEINLTSKISGRFRAQATSSDTQVAQASASQNARNHWLLETVAGPNNTDQDKFATVTVNITKDVVNFGFPPPDQPRRGRVVDNPPLGTREITDNMTVRVLAAKKCADLPPEQPRQVGRVGQEGRAARPASARSLKICTESARRFEVDSMIRTNYPQRTKTLNNQPATSIRSLTEKSNTNPAAVEVGIYGQYNDNGELAATPLQLVFMGWQQGEATIVIEESHPLPVNVLPWKETWNVTVEDCDEQVRRAQIQRAYLPADYQFFRPVQQERSWLDDEIAELKQEFGQFTVPADDRHALVTPQPEEGRQGLTENFDTVVKAGLVTMTTIIDDTNVAIHCPSEAQGGDLISCSVISDDPEKVNPNDYLVQLESITTITEESRDMKKAMISATLPAGIGGAILVMKNKMGQEISRGELPVKPSGIVGQPPSEVMFPRQTVLGEPMMFKGPFTQPLSETAVTVDGQQANILARSSSSLVVENPAITEGAKSISVQTGENVVSGPVQMFSPQTIARQLEVPQELTEPSEVVSGQHGQVGQDSPAVDAACQQQVDIYKAQLRSRVDSQWSPPKPPSRGTWTTVLGYNLLPDLSVTDVKVVKPSGHLPVDQSAVKRVYQLNGQFSPLPTCYDKPYLPIEHTFKVIYR